MVEEAYKMIEGACKMVEEAYKMIEG